MIPTMLLNEHLLNVTGLLKLWTEILNYMKTGTWTKEELDLDHKDNYL